ncbi:MAG: multidrug efflux MFS transporter [Bacteroidia bacterium]|nr:multidrug efflux MFS transporter [Bacteroidia bacterium]
MQRISFDKWVIIFTVVSASMLQLIDTSIVNVTLTQMMGNLGATLGDISWVVTAYAAANVVMITLSGWLSAKLGRRNYFTASIIVFTLGSIFCGTATNVWELVAFRVLQGIGGGGLMSTAQAILIQTFPREDIGMANAIFGLGVIIGPTIGPTLGGYITDHLSWHWVFFINIPFGIIATVLSLLFIKDPQETIKTGKMDWLALVLLISAIAAIQIVLEKGESEDWFDTSYITVLTLISVIGGGIFIWRQLTVEYPILNLRLLKHSRFAIGTFFGFVQGFGLFASVFIIPVFCQSMLGYTAEQTGWLLMPGSIASAFAMPVVGQLMKGGKVSPVLLAGIGFGSFIVFVWMLSGMTLNTGENDFFIPLIIRGVGMGLLFIPLTTITVYDLDNRDMPQGTALTNMVRQLGGSFGIAIMTTFLSTRSVFHISRLSESVTSFNQATIERLQGITALLMSKGDSYNLAQSKALIMIKGTVAKQAMILAYNDAFLLVGIFFMACLPLLLLFNYKGKKKPEKPNIELHFAE